MTAKNSTLASKTSMVWNISLQEFATCPRSDGSTILQFSLTGDDEVKADQRSLSYAFGSARYTVATPSGRGILNI